MGGKGSKTSSVAIPKAIEGQLMPYLADTLAKNRSFADKTWANMMPGSASQLGGGNLPTYGPARGNPDLLALLKQMNDSDPGNDFNTGD